MRTRMKASFRGAPWVIVRLTVVAAWTTVFFLSSSSSSRFDPSAISIVIGVTALSTPAASSPASASSSPSAPPSFLVIGGSGKIGTAVARHLLWRRPDSSVTLAGRSAVAGRRAVEELGRSLPKQQQNSDESAGRHGDNEKIRFERLCINQRIQTSGASQNQQQQEYQDLVQYLRSNSYDCVIHTAGPYADCRPVVLQACLEAGNVAAYVDVADPLPYLECGLLMNNNAGDKNEQQCRTTALLSAGAFPGMSNVLAMETAQQAVAESGSKVIKDVTFNYFTAGLGGSGTVNLYITNLGFGDAMGVYDQGALRFLSSLSGRLLGTVDFFLSSNSKGFSNEQARTRVGTKQVFAWPFPEAATVPTHLQIRGSSSAAMGTAPDVWNTILGILVAVVPRPWWRNERFSQFLADFSEPLVWLTDQFWLKRQDPAGVGETHAMRIDVTTTTTTTTSSVRSSTVQAHDSFRQCVGQSCAEFALDCLAFPGGGVSLPEQRYRDASARQRIIGKLTSTPGTFCYATSTTSAREPAQPTELSRVFQEAVEADT